MNRRTFIATVSAAVATIAIQSDKSPGGTMSYAWHRPVVNGGFCNVVAAGLVAGEFYVGGDMYGPHVTADIAASWLPQAHGATGIGDTYAQAVVASPLHHGVAYYGVGTLKSTGGSFSVISGNSIAHRSKAIGFATGLSSGAAAQMPRPTGRRISVLVVNGAEDIMAASNLGIAESHDEGKTWSVLGKTGNCRSIQMLGAGEALAAGYMTNSLFHAKAGKVSSIGSPGVIHDINSIAGVVWAVGPGGLYQWNGTALVKHPASTYFAGSAPSSIDGSADGMFLVVGTVTPGAKSAAVSHDGGHTWTWIGGSAIQKTLWNGDAFWLGWANNIFGGSHYAVSQVAVDKENPLNVMFAGRNGVWGSRDGCKTVHPCGPGGSEDQSVRVGPGPNEFACNDNDWVGLHTTDGWKTMTRQSTAPGGNTGLSASAGGHSVVVSGTDVKVNGVSVMDEVAQGSVPFACCVGVNASGMVTIGLYGGGVLVGVPV